MTNIISYQDYKEQVLKFRSDTSDWLTYDIFSYYTTSDSGWKESSDNAHGGFDLSWAFHNSSFHNNSVQERDIIKHYLMELLNRINYLYDTGLDEFINYTEFEHYLWYLNDKQNNEISY